ncbi:DUF1127 domain-containing protein [Primorskyibacter sp. S187A]|uniref:DUF1127 domain-containing protein n=1 Tax=Primorskyibacter sp. S187A TaxID=3415130 RepID=UPI003C7C6C10
MAHITTNTHHSTGLFARVADIFQTLRLRWTRYTIYRKTLAELSALTPRELDDLGITPSMIRRIAYQSAYQ